MTYSVYDHTPIGRIRQILTRPGQEPVVIREHTNLVVLSAVEMMLQALMGRDSIQNIQFGLTGERPITSGIRTIGSPVATTPVNQTDSSQTIVSKDSAGLRTIGTFIGVYAATGSLSYDTLGLASSTGLLFAASTNFGTVPLVSGDSITVEWTILLRGVGG